MADRAAELLDRRIQDLSDRLNRLRALRQFISEDPALVTEITSLLLSPEANGKIVVPSPGFEPPQNPHFIKIIEYLKTREDWVSAKDISHGSGIELTKVYAILQKSHSEHFDCYQKSPKRHFWRPKNREQPLRTPSQHEVTTAA